jgi:acetyltransferase EpsM
MATKILILGAGGMAREILEGYVSKGQEDSIMGFVVSSRFFKNSSLLGRPVYDEAFLNSISTGNVRLIAGIGTPDRKKWVLELEKKGFIFETFIHPHASVGKNVQIKEGVVICSGAVITTNVQIGRHSIVNILSGISHDVTIGNFVTIGPGSHITGGVTIEDEVFVGAGVTLKPGVSIASRVFLGAGAVVIENINKSNILAYGNPAHKVRVISKKDWEKFV